MTFYQFPQAHWRHLRTTNVVESPFAAVRLRTTAAKRFKNITSATALIWKLLQVAEQTFRRLNAPELLPLVYPGVEVSGWEACEALGPRGPRRLMAIYTPLDKTSVNGNHYRQFRKPNYIMHR